MLNKSSSTTSKVYLYLTRIENLNKNTYVINKFKKKNQTNNTRHLMNLWTIFHIFHLSAFFTIMSIEDILYKLNI